MRVSCLASLLLACVVHAQATFDLRSRARLPRVANYALQVLPVDLDSDGDQDIVRLTSFQSPPTSSAELRVLINDGKGYFSDETSTRLPATQRNAIGVAAGDLDGNGSADLFVVLLGQNYVLFNDGAGKFRVGGLPIASFSSRAVALGDVDGDGDLDAFVANEGTQNQLLLNNSRGVFQYATSANLPADTLRSAAAALVDLDGDRDLDLVLGNGTPGRKEANLVYLNDGRGRFTAKALPGAPSEFTTCLAVGDLNGDGSVDLLFGNTAAADEVYFNDGRAGFTAASPAWPADLTTSLTLLDVDGDRDLDLYVTINRAFNQQYLNDGRGGFTLDTGGQVGQLSGSSFAAAAVDIDGDRRTDLYVGHDDQDVVGLNDGTRHFAADHQPKTGLDAIERRRLATPPVDIDGDGHVDILLMAGYFFLGDGRGGFRLSLVDRLSGMQNPFTPSSRPVASVLVDVDGDGDVDLVTADGQRQLALLLNDGRGNFADDSAARLPRNFRSLDGIYPADLDGDGDVDLYVDYGTTTYSILINRNGRFTDETAQRFTRHSNSRWPFVIADLDGDRDLDFFFHSLDGTASFYFNDGSGVFALDPTDRLAGSEFRTPVTAGDVNGDGAVDLVCRGSLFTKIMMNDGRARFTPSAPADFVCNTGLYTACFADLDGDGDTDLVGSDGGSVRNLIFINTGNGRLVDWYAGGDLVDRLSNADHLTVADVDEDGDIDVLALGAPDPRVRVFFNRSRDLWATRGPELGRPYRLGFTDRPGTSTGRTTAVAALSTGPARIALPGLGTLGLDPATLFLLPAVVLPAPAGTVELPFPVPAASSLRGVRFFVQAVFARPTDTRLSNVLAEVIR